MVRTTTYRKFLATVIAVLFSALATVGLQATPAHAAYGVCNTTATYTFQPNPSIKIVIPHRTDNGSSCYISYRTGSAAAVTAIQRAIYYCYPGTFAYNKMMATGGIDGIYGSGMVEAMKWIQANKLGLSGASVDGVYGPTTGSRMQWSWTDNSGNCSPWWW